MSLRDLHKGFFLTYKKKYESIFFGGGHRIRLGSILTIKRTSSSGQAQTEPGPSREVFAITKLPPTLSLLAARRSRC